jgi:hypothetical protein
VSRKGAHEVEAKGLAGPVAREVGVVGSAKEMVGWVEVFPRGISGRE